MIENRSQSRKLGYQEGTTKQGPYTQNLAELFKKENLSWGNTHKLYHPSATKVSYFNNNGKSWNSHAGDDVIQIVRNEVKHHLDKSCTDSLGICLVENITPAWIEALGTKFNLDPHFFLEHARNPPKAECLEASLSQEYKAKIIIASKGKHRNERYPSHVHVNGVYKYLDVDTD
jgi:hypothetical protein